MNIWKTALAAGSVIATRQAINAARDLHANDILGAIGLERRRSAFEVALPALGMFLGGAALGAGVALLVAPMSGKELRSEIGKRASDVKERASRGVEELEERIQHSTGNAFGRNEARRES